MGLLSGLLGGGSSKVSYGLAPESQMQQWARPLYQEQYRQYDPSVYTQPLAGLSEQLMGFNPYLSLLSGNMAGIGGDIAGLMPSAMDYGGQAAGYGGLGAGYGGLSAGYGGLGANYGGQAANYGSLGPMYGQLGAQYGGMGADIGQQAAGSAGQYGGGMANLANAIAALSGPAMGAVSGNPQMIAGAMQQFLNPTGTDLYQNAMGSYGDQLGKRISDQFAATSGVGQQTGGRWSSGDIASRQAIADTEARNLGSFGSNLALGLSGQGGQLYPQFAGLGLQGIGQAGNLLSQGLSGLGQAGQLGQQGYGTALSGLGLGMSGAQLGLQGLGTGIAGSQAGMQGAQTGIQGALGGVQGANTGITGSLGGLQGSLGAGQLGTQASGTMGQSLAPIALAMQNLMSQPELLNMIFGYNQQMPMQWLQQGYSMTPGVVQTGTSSQQGSFGGNLSGLLGNLGGLFAGGAGLASGLSNWFPWGGGMAGMT